MFLKPFFSSLAILLSLAVSSCSGVDSSEVVISCGNEINQDQVMVLDLRSLGSQPDLVTDFVSERVGAYRLITTQPIGIPLGNSKRTGSHDYIQANHPTEGMDGIGVAQIEAALRGCNLVLALEQKIVAPKGGPNNSSFNRTGVRVWVVHFGMREV